MSLPPPEPVLTSGPDIPGLQVSVLGANTPVGHNIALLLKQCPCIRILRLYEATTGKSRARERSLLEVAEDLKYINTSCHVQLFRCSPEELKKCLQCTDIVLMLESAFLSPEIPMEKRFCFQAPIVKAYADVIADQCPKAFIIVCATPIDCMVPLVAQTLIQSGYYNPRKLLGSVAVPEMRASTLTARALHLEPRCTRVPCVGGTEGEALVPLFSKAVDHFTFSKKNAEMMMQTIRNAQLSVVNADDDIGKRNSDLSEAHALAGLVTSVAQALTCQATPIISGFVPTDNSNMISPAKYLATPVKLRGDGLIALDTPNMNEFEISLVNVALNDLCYKLHLVNTWFEKCEMPLSEQEMCRTQFHMPRHYSRFEECVHSY